jgi:flagellar biosynthesis chaperone FliJ
MEKVKFEDKNLVYSQTKYEHPFEYKGKKGVLITESNYNDCTDFYDEYIDEEQSDKFTKEEKYEILDAFFEKEN